MWGGSCHSFIPPVPRVILVSSRRSSSRDSPRWVLRPVAEPDPPLHGPSPPSHGRHSTTLRSSRSPTAHARCAANVERVRRGKTGYEERLLIMTNNKQKGKKKEPKDKILVIINIRSHERLFYSYKILILRDNKITFHIQEINNKYNKEKERILIKLAFLCTLLISFLIIFY